MDGMGFMNQKLDANIYLELETFTLKMMISIG